MPRAFRLLVAIAGLTVLMSGSGCVVSEASRYERQLSATVKADLYADVDVVAAFDLRRNQPHVAVTALRDP